MHIRVTWFADPKRGSPRRDGQDSVSARTRVSSSCGLNGFVTYAFAPALCACGHIALAGVRGQQDDRERGLPLPKSPRHLDAGEARHGHIENREIGIAARRELERFQPVIRRDDGVAGPFEPQTNQHANVRIVVGDEDKRVRNAHAQSIDPETAKVIRRPPYDVSPRRGTCRGRPEPSSA